MNGLEPGMPGSTRGLGVAGAPPTGVSPSSSTGARQWVGLASKAGATAFDLPRRLPQGRSVHPVSRLRAALTLALTALAGACVREATPPAAQVEAPSCLVDGEPLESIASPTGFCMAGAPNEDLANGLRLYQQERYEEAAAAFEREIRSGRDPEWPSWWEQARFYLAKTYRHLGRGPEVEALLLAIARSPGDSHRWAAAGWLCGDLRPSPHDVFTTPRCPVPAEDPPVVIAAGPIPPRDGLVVPSADPLPTRPYGSVVSRVMRAARPTIAACGDHADDSALSPARSIRVEYVFSSDGSVRSVSVRIPGYPTDLLVDPGIERCVQEAARRVWLPPFTDATFTTPG